MHINDILTIQDERKRSDSLRKHFAPYSEVIDVTGSEAVTMVVLVNLSVKRGAIKDLSNRESARNIMADKKHILSCIQEIAWQHSHNLKHPDARVSGGRIMVSSPLHYAGYISSHGLERELGWSHNSAAYNNAKMFCATFLWNGHVRNLSTILDEGRQVWRDSIQSLGLKDKNFDELVSFIKEYDSRPDFPPEVSLFSPQVRFFYHGNYVAITPVVSHTMMAHIQRLARRKVGFFARLAFPRSAAIGDLAGSMGGNINILHYPPSLRSSASGGLSGSRINAIMEGEYFFDTGCLFDKNFLAACEVLRNAKRFSTDRGRRQEKRYAISKMKSALVEWLDPVYEWREAIEEEMGEPISGLADSLEWRISSLRGKPSSALVRELSRVLNGQLGSHRKTRHLAYHYELMTPLKTILRKVLSEGSPRENPMPQLSRSEESHGSYLYLKGMRVYDASAMANPYLCGIPSLTALWGLIKEYEIKLKALSHTDVEFDGVAWFLREYQERGDTKIPAPKLSEEPGRLMRSGLLPSRYCDMTMDVVVRVHDPDLELAAIDHQLLQAACPGRFAGGALHPPSLQDEHYWCQVDDGDNLFKKLRRLPHSGRWVTPSTIQSDSLLETLDLCNKFSDLRPVSAGYALLEDPVERVGSLMVLHAYAESLISMARLVSPIEYRWKGWEVFAQQAFWGMQPEKCAMLMARA
ncbi:CRISPR-associated protein Csy2 [Modicisalibacter muralis]|uniref:CRISPR-associated protein Csy2 n=1 Tax=Modicisalibacter muralis TaxID=119000 RepID=A0A1G9LHQ9_9GAMM|nr:type I-F CRISPR-associated protein Csy2 [Halomonas muralis]SDL61479.1 CRISPR-associated protein Csy2 [Halomonas muralis]